MAQMQGKGIDASLWSSHKFPEVTDLLKASLPKSLLRACMHGHQGVSLRTLAQIWAAFL